jgi:hypothetical protein
MNAASAEDTALRPFRAAIPDEAIAELRKRIAAAVAEVAVSGQG